MPFPEWEGISHLHRVTAGVAQKKPSESCKAQTATSIQEQTLIFIPKILAVFICIILLSPWMGQRMLVMTREILGQLERFIQ